MSKNKIKGNTLTIKTDKPIPIYGADSIPINSVVVKCEDRVVATLKGVKIIKEKITKL